MWAHIYPEEALPWLMSSMQCTRFHNTGWHLAYKTILKHLLYLLSFFWMWRKKREPLAHEPGFSCPSSSKHTSVHFTESQNCRGWKRSPEIIKYKPLLKSRFSTQVAQVSIQVGLEYLQRRLHNISGQPAPVLCHLDSEEVLPCVSMELPVF